MLQVAPDWPSGVYFVQLTADDGRIGYAPLIVRPAKPQSRVAVVLPTTTWGAYNFHDADGDGWGDTWYARWKTNRADLTRPNPNRGVPYRYRSYDVAFQHWLARTGKNVDFYADEDLEAFAGPAALRAAYDLIVFPGHTEYVTSRLYDLIEGYRNAGGNLMFLSANNFFRRVDRHGHAVELIDEWRDLGRPESGSSACSTTPAIAASVARRSSSPEQKSRRGHSRVQGSRTDTRSACTASRPTSPRPHLHSACRCWQ